MLLPLLFLAGSAAASSAPSISGLAVTQFGGACGPPRTNTKIRSQWIVTNPNDTLYEIHASVNADGVTVLPCSTVVNFYDTGLVGGSGSVMTFAATVQLVRKSDSAIVQTLTGSNTGRFSDCAL